MQEYGEIPNYMKFEQLVFWTEQTNDYDANEKVKKEFAQMLQTMPVDLVRQNTLTLVIHLQTGEHQKCAWKRNSAAGCPSQEPERLCSHFAGTWVCLLVSG